MSLFYNFIYVKCGHSCWHILQNAILGLVLKTTSSLRVTPLDCPSGLSATTRGSSSGRRPAVAVGAGRWTRDAVPCAAGGVRSLSAAGARHLHLGQPHAGHRGALQGPVRGDAHLRPVHAPVPQLAESETPYIHRQPGETFTQ